MFIFSIRMFTFYLRPVLHQSMEFAEAICLRGQLLFIRSSIDWWNLSKQEEA
jgi:hypothetical protein